jgi:hypothetical protein
MPTYAAAAILIAALAQPTSDPRPTNPDAYQVLSGEELAGSGFVTRHRGRLWGVMSIHQFDGGTPSRLVQLEGEPSQVLLQREGALRQTDVQAFPLKDQATAVPFLAYDPAFTLVSGAALLILGPAGEAVPAKLGATGEFRCSQGSKRLTAYPERPFTAAGGSGAPVVLKSTGTVIGVLLSADDLEAARRVQFETLCLANATTGTARKGLSRPQALLVVLAGLLIVVVLGASVVVVITVRLIKERSRKGPSEARDTGARPPSAGSGDPESSGTPHQSG